MIAKWQLVGFAHGVMNTDNLNITGSTLDFWAIWFYGAFPPQLDQQSLGLPRPLYLSKSTEYRSLELMDVVKQFNPSR